jgi:hypothetical protein
MVLKGQIDLDKIARHWADILRIISVTLWNTVYLDRALTELRAQGYPVLDEDVACLSAYPRKHINVHGHYSFKLPELGGAWRPLRDPDHRDPDEDS